jgi:hypothetical protein
MYPRLVKIVGNLWELTILQITPYDKTDGHEEEINKAIIMGYDGCNRGCIRFLAKNGVRSKADAIIEILVNGLPQQKYYAVYHNSKGFYSKVQGKIVYLKDLDR